MTARGRVATTTTLAIVIEYSLYTTLLSGDLLPKMGQQLYAGSGIGGRAKIWARV